MNCIVAFLLAMAGPVAFKGNDTLPPVDKITYDQFHEIFRRDSGKVVLVNAWATWCQPCREEMPALIRLQKEVGKENLSLIILSADDLDSLEDVVRPALREFGIDFKTYIMNEKQETFMSAMNPEWGGAFALPTTYVYDRRGTLVDMLVGGKKYEDFSKEVTKLIAN